MDPDVTLAELRRLSAEPISLDNCEQLAGYFDDLDEWLTKGGFLPLDWSRHRRPTTR